MERDAQWEVRTPRRYGSEHHSLHNSEAEARAVAEKIAQEKWDGAGLQIHTGPRIIYIYPDRDD